ncbi:MAG: two-component system LytT family response regulator [Polaribacter sp.]|jgi:two-component system LytT family response regulator
MNRITTIIVDDEPLALSLLKSKLNKIEEVEIVAECKNGREAIQAVIDLEPQLLFLDIQMPGIDGLGVIKQLQMEIVPLVVFTTAYEQYALDAFEIHAVDYILKPIDGERINRAVQRAISRLKTGQELAHKPRIISAINSINQTETSFSNQKQVENKNKKDNIVKKIIIRDRDEITLLEQSDIEWIDAAGDYVCLHSKGITHIKRSTLKNILSKLNPDIFKRIHRSTIVNLNHIKKVIPYTKGEYYLKLGEYDQVKVSRNYRDAIKNYLAGS